MRKRDILVEFPRHPKIGEDPWYEPMEAWMNAVETNIQINRALVLLSLVMVSSLTGLILGVLLSS